MSADQAPSWGYLFLCNFVWVAIPLWFLYEAYLNVVAAFRASAAVVSREKKK